MRKCEKVKENLEADDGFMDGFFLGKNLVKLLV